MNGIFDTRNFGNNFNPKRYNILFKHKFRKFVNKLKYGVAEGYEHVCSPSIIHVLVDFQIILPKGHHPGGSAELVCSVPANGVTDSSVLHASAQHKLTQTCLLRQIRISVLMYHPHKFV